MAKRFKYQCYKVIFFLKVYIANGESATKKRCKTAVIYEVEHRMHFSVSSNYKRLRSQTRQTNSDYIFMKFHRMENPKILEVVWILL
jgi:hypothetical protein